jgi:hypothetical protein
LEVGTGWYKLRYAALIKYFLFNPMIFANWVKNAYDLLALATTQALSYLLKIGVTELAYFFKYYALKPG